MALFRRSKKNAPSVAQEQPKAARTVVSTAPEPRRGLAPRPVADEHGRRSVADQRDFLLSAVEPLPAFGMYLLDAWGLAVCEDIVAVTSQPAQDLAGRDGYAVRSSLAIPGARVRGQRVRVGEPLPDGTDAIVPDEFSDTDGHTVAVNQPIRAGDYVRQAGSDVKDGTPLIRSGEVLDARLSGMLAGAGFDRVMAHPRPRVVVLNVLDPKASTPEEQTRADVNSHLIASALKADGAQVWRVGMSQGSDTDLRNLVSDQLIRADLIVAAAGLATQQLVDVLGSMGETDVAEVALQPGGRFGFSVIGDDRIPVALLPFDPVAAYVSYQAFVRPLVRKLMGAPKPEHEALSARSGSTIEAGNGFTVARAVKLTDSGEDLVATVVGSDEQQSLTNLAASNGLVLVEPWTESVAVGDTVQVWRLDD